MKLILIGTISFFMNLNMMLFGGLDFLLKAFFSLLVIDYITGISKAFKNKELSHRVAILGVVKKIGYISIVATSVILDNLIGASGMIRNMVLYSFLFNEMLSILENCTTLGIPLPSIIKESIAKAQEKVEEKQDNL